jgi:predicted DNA-binding WGR domain protein
MPLIPPGVRYFECVDFAANTDKFWAIQFVPVPYATAGVALRIMWGRRFTDGQEKFVTKASTDLVIAEAERRLEKKLGEGYVQVPNIPWDHRMVRGARRAPSPPEARSGEDGWPLSDGREVRPSDGRRAVLRGPMPIVDTERRTPDLARGRSRTVATVVRIANDRTIDFED